MSFDGNWDVEKYKEDHESDEHWALRRAFMERWKTDYSEERLVCLARVFANIEFMGCRYPSEVMHEVAGLSHEIVQSYRNSRKNKLQRTFVSASAAAEDRAKGVKRVGGFVKAAPPSKSSKIEFVRQGQNVPANESSDSENDNDDSTKVDNGNENIAKENVKSDPTNLNVYIEEMSSIKCLDIRSFRESMFQTAFGKLVLLLRPWTGKLSNIQSSCQGCGVDIKTVYEKGVYYVTIDGQLVASAKGSKTDARNIAEALTWTRLREEAISVVIKEQFIAQGDARISVSDVSKRSSKDIFGTPVENSVATKMMKLMGWKGGGLGADAQGIEEPIKPNMQMVNRAGLGSNSTDIRALKRLGGDLIRRYASSDTFDLDLVFSSEFSKEERAALHQVAQRAGLASRSYGDKDRFLVVRKKIEPFSLARAVIEKGGVTPKFQVFIPAKLLDNGR